MINRLMTVWKTTGGAHRMYSSKVEVNESKYLRLWGECNNKIMEPSKTTL